MKYDPVKHHRRSIRLKGYDYARRGAYFVTLCVQNRECALGEIVGGEMHPNRAGRMIEKWWLELNHKFAAVDTDEYVIMPNHFHGIVIIVNPAPTIGADFGAVGADLRVGPVTDVGAVVGADLCVGPVTDVRADLRVGPVTDVGAIVGADLRVGPAPGLDLVQSEHVGSPLPTIVQWFKTMTTNEYIREVKQSGWPPFPGKFWQRNYYEHIVRDEADLARIRAYLQNNPAKWALDQLHPAAPPNPYNGDQS
jgi:putative transposase